MITNTKNKSMAEENTEKKNLQEFHFPGEGKFVPQTIRAATQEEAEAEHLRTRQPVAKVEEHNEEK